MITKERYKKPHVADDGMDDMILGYIRKHSPASTKDLAAFCEEHPRKITGRLFSMLTRGIVTKSFGEKTRSAEWSIKE